MMADPPTKTLEATLRSCAKSDCFSEDERLCFQSALDKLKEGNAFWAWQCVDEVQRNQEKRAVLVKRLVQLFVRVQKCAR
jgi:hypothetical protein